MFGDRLILARRFYFLGLGLFWVVSAGLIVAIQLKIDRIRPSTQRIEELRFLPSSSFLRVASLGYREFAADLLWLKAVQFVSGKDQTGKGYDWLYHVLDTVTDLDPKFYDSYWLGAMSLSVLGDRPDQSVLLLRKGTAEITNRWELYFYLGFDYYYFLNDFKNAAISMEKASVLPGRPAFLPPLTARLYAEAQSPTTGLNFIQGVYTTTQDPEIRRQLEKIGKALEVRVTLEALDRAAKEFESKYPKEAPSTDRLLALGFIRTRPVDPYGGTYYWDEARRAFQTTSKPDEVKVHIDEAGRRR